MKTGVKGRKKNSAKSKKQSNTENLSKNGPIEQKKSTIQEKLDSIPTIISPLLDTDLENDLPILPFVSSSLTAPFHGNSPLQWDHRVNLIGEKCPSPNIHLCDKCAKPILIYGRLIPCKHVFCYSCAKVNNTCPRCNELIIKLERTALGTVYMCTYENCCRTYLSQRDLQAHIQHRHIRKLSQPKQIETKSSPIKPNIFRKRNEGLFPARSPVIAAPHQEEISEIQNSPFNRHGIGQTTANPNQLTSSWARSIFSRPFLP